MPKAISPRNRTDKKYVCVPRIVRYFE